MFDAFANYQKLLLFQLCVTNFIVHSYLRTLFFNNHMAASYEAIYTEWRVYYTEKTQKYSSTRRKSFNLKHSQQEKKHEALL